jgi:NAD(P)-dependent dehydrogenase (short-subunit alcohol dehydrogenase family)
LGGITEQSHSSAQRAADVERRIVLVTGASRGIGRAAALALARQKNFIVGTARESGNFGSLADDIVQAGGDCWLSACELADSAEIQRLTDIIGARYGRLDGLFINAGVLGPKKPIRSLAPEEFTRTLAINVLASFQLLHHCDELLRKSSAGRVLLVTSGVAWKRHAGWSPYAVSKAAIEALAGVYANEIADTNIRVNLISPGPIRTELRTEAWPEEDPSGVPPPEALGPEIVRLLSPEFRGNGLIYDFRSGRNTRSIPPQPCE